MYLSLVNRSFTARKKTENSTVFSKTVVMTGVNLVNVRLFNNETLSSPHRNGKECLFSKKCHNLLFF